MRRLNEYGHFMVRSKLEKDVWLVRILVQNGLGFYATWGGVASIFNFAIVLTYRTGLTPKRQEVGSTVSLIIFTLEIFSWFILDNFVFEQTLRYLYTPYIAILVSLIGIISNNFDPSKRNSLYTASLLGAALFLTVSKFLLSAWRHHKRPIYSNTSQKYQRPMMSFEARNLLEQQ